MRFKPVPEPPADRAGLERARRALALVPDPTESPCDRLADRLDIDRSAARAWLAWLRALGLAERTPDGYRRVDPSPDALRAALRERVLAGAATLDALGPEPATAARIAAATADHQPDWERAREPDPERAWRERTRRLLGWVVLLGLAQRHDAGYVSVSGSPDA